MRLDALPAEPEEEAVAEATRVHIRCDESVAEVEVDVRAAVTQVEAEVEMAPKSKEHPGIGPEAERGIGRVTLMKPSSPSSAAPMMPNITIAPTPRYNSVPAPGINTMKPVLS